MPSLKSIPKASAVATIQAGGTVVEGLTRKKVDGDMALVPVLKLRDAKGTVVGKLSNVVFGHLLHAKVIQRAPGQTDTFVKV